MIQESQISANIKAIIKEKGMIQSVVEQRAGLPNKALSSMLHGRRVIRAADLPPIAKALGVDVNQLLRLEEQ